MYDAISNIIISFKITNTTYLRLNSLVVALTMRAQYSEGTTQNRAE